MNNADVDGLPLLDAEIIAELREVMEEEFSNLIWLFLDDLPLQLDRLQIAVTAQDTVSIYQTAHKLKSSCGNLGLVRLTELCRRLEQAGRLHTLDGAAELLQHTPAAADEAAVCLRAVVG